PEAREAALDTTHFKRNQWLGIFLGVPVVMLVIALVYFVIFRFFYGGEIGFVGSLAIVSWTSVAVALVKWPLQLITLYLKGDWNIHPEYILQASPAALIERGTVARPLYA